MTLLLWLIYYGIASLLCVDVSEGNWSTSQASRIKRPVLTITASTVTPVATPKCLCHDSHDNWKSEKDSSGSLVEDFCNNTKVEDTVLQPDESLDVELSDATNKLVHAFSISWIPSCPLKSQVCNSHREDDSCNHWISTLLEECKFSSNPLRL